MRCTRTLAVLLLWASGAPVAETAPWRAFEAKGPASAVALTPDDRFVAAAFYRSAVNDVRVWEVSSRKQVAHLDVRTGDGHSLAFSPGGDFLLVADQIGDVRIWGTSDWKEGKALGHPETVSGVRNDVCLAWSPDGRLLAAGLGHNPFVRPQVNAVIQIWNWPDRSLARKIVLDQVSLEKVSFTRDGKSLVVNRGSGALLLTSVESGATVGEWKVYGSDHQLTRDGGRIVFGQAYENRVVACRLAAAGDPEVIWEGKGHANTPDSIALDALDSLVASACRNFLDSKDTLVRLWSLETGKRVASFVADDKGVAQMVFTSDGKYLVTAGLRTGVRFWEREALLKK